MNEPRADQLVVGCLAATAAIGAGNAIVAGHAPAAKQIVGLTFAAVGLAVGAMFAPGLAGGTAVLILTTTALLYGGPLWDAVSSVTNTNTASSAAPSSTSTPPRKVNA